MKLSYFTPRPLLLVAVLLQLNLIALVAAVKLEITHWNDINGQIESFHKGTSNSTKAPVSCNGGEVVNCTGGVVNLVHHIHEPAADIPNYYRMRLGAGNAIGGESGWIASIGWESYAEYLQTHFEPTALALGMKEFGAGVDRTITFMNGTQGKATVANTCLQNHTGVERDFCGLLNNIVIEEIDETPIGIVGFVTPNVERFSLPGRLKFAAVAEAIKTVVGSYSHIKTFIAIGDANLELAKEIIDEVPQIKLVIYGSGLSNTQDMSDNYPLEYNGRLIATAGRYGSSIGKLVLDWDLSSGNLTATDESRIVETTYPESGFNERAMAALRDFQNLQGPVAADKANQVGHSGVPLESGEVCWRQECNFGNLVADAMVHCLLVQTSPATPIEEPVHSVWHGGAFFEETFPSKSNITKFDINKWLPYHNRAHFVGITGSDLKTVFVKSATGIDPGRAGENYWRQFLQVSRGMQVVYRTDEFGVPQLDKIRLTHLNERGIPELGDLREDQTYQMAIPTFLFEGRGVYADMGSLWSPMQHGNITSNFAFDDDCVEGYIRALKQVSVGLEERIVINRNGKQVKA